LEESALPTSHSEDRSVVLGNKMQSPSLMQQENPQCHAYEMKFLISRELAAQIQEWSRSHLERDPYANPQRNDSYEIHTLYLDSPNKDMFHRREGYRNEKYRLRNYAQSKQLYLEHKKRRGDRVSKIRSEMELQHWPHTFHRENGHTAALHQYKQTLQAKQLVPSCRMSYERAAYMASDAQGVLRLTLDRHIRGELTNDWQFLPVMAGTNILEEAVICELKFRDTLPQRFKSLIAEFQLQPSAVSKYRRFIQNVLGISPENEPSSGAQFHG
jgi:VTC domain